MRLIIYILPFLACCSTFSQNLISGGKLKPEQAIMDIRHYTVALDVDPLQKSINGYTEIDLILSHPTDRLLFDLWHGMAITKVEVNSKVQNFKHSKDDLVSIQLPAYLPAGK